MNLIKKSQMIIRNKKLIGVISILVGVGIIGYLVFVSKVAFTGHKTDALVTGFVVHQNGSRKVQNENSSIKKTLKGRSPFVKFTTENGQEVEAHSKILQLFSVTGYHEGEKVKEGDTLLVLEAMKMEHKIVSTKEAKVQKILFKENDRVSQGEELIILA